MATRGRRQALAHPSSHVALRSGVGEASFQTVAPPFIDDNAPADKKALWLSIFFMGALAARAAPARRWTCPQPTPPRPHAPAIPVGTALGFAYSSIVASSRGLNLGWRAAFLYEIPAMVPLALMALFVPKKYAERRAKGAAKSSQPVEYDALAEGGSKEGSSTKLISAADDADDSPDLSIKDELRNITRSPVYLCSVAGYAAYTFVTMVRGRWLAQRPAAAPPDPPPPRPPRARCLQGFATFGSDFLLQMHIFPSEESASITFGLIVALAGLIGAAAGSRPCGGP